jgi:hypothetical protein
MIKSIVFTRMLLLRVHLLGKLLLIVLGLSTSVYAATTSFKPQTMAMVFHGEKMSAIINDVPLTQVIKEFSKSTGIKVVWQGGETARIVKLNFTALSPGEAARRVLKNENYILYYTCPAGKEKLEKIIIIPREKGEKKQTLVAQIDPETNSYLMTDEPEFEIPEGEEMEEPVDYDNQELIDILREQLLSEGNIEAAESLSQSMDNAPLL